MPQPQSFKRKMPLLILFASIVASASSTVSTVVSKAVKNLKSYDLTQVRASGTYKPPDVNCRSYKILQQVTDKSHKINTQYFQESFFSGRTVVAHNSTATMCTIKPETAGSENSCCDQEMYKPVENILDDKTTQKKTSGQNATCHKEKWINKDLHYCDEETCENLCSKQYVFKFDDNTGTSVGTSTYDGKSLSNGEVCKCATLKLGKPETLDLATIKKATKKDGIDEENPDTGTIWVQKLTCAPGSGKALESICGNFAFMSTKYLDTGSTRWWEKNEYHEGTYKPDPRKEGKADYPADAKMWVAGYKNIGSSSTSLTFRYENKYYEKATRDKGPYCPKLSDGTDLKEYEGYKEGKCGKWTTPNPIEGGNPIIKYYDPKLVVNKKFCKVTYECEPCPLCSHTGDVDFAAVTGTGANLEKDDPSSTAQKEQKEQPSYQAQKCAVQGHDINPWGAQTEEKLTSGNKFNPRYIGSKIVFVPEKTQDGSTTSSYSKVGTGDFPQFSTTPERGFDTWFHVNCSDPFFMDEPHGSVPPLGEIDNEDPKASPIGCCHIKTEKKEYGLCTTRSYCLLQQVTKRKRNEECLRRCIQQPSSMEHVSCQKVSPPKTCPDNCEKDKVERRVCPYCGGDVPKSLKGFPKTHGYACCDCCQHCAIEADNVLEINATWNEVDERYTLSGSVQSSLGMTVTVFLLSLLW